MDQELVDAAACALWDAECALTGRQHFLRHRDSMTSYQSNCQLMHIYLNNDPAKFHPNLIWNARALGFFEEVTPTWTARWVVTQDKFLIQKLITV